MDVLQVDIEEECDRWLGSSRLFKSCAQSCFLSVARTDWQGSNLDNKQYCVHAYSSSALCSMSLQFDFDSCGVCLRQPLTVFLTKVLNEEKRQTQRQRGKAFENVFMCKAKVFWTELH